MPITLMDFCNNLRDCAEKLEEELKTNINDCHNMVIDGLATDVKVAIEKAKDFHYKEILRFLSDIITNIRKILVHEETIRKLSDQEKLSEEELKRYSYVQRQVSNFGGAVVKREKRRLTSELSLCSLEAWEQYLNKKEKEESSKTSSDTNFNTVPKRRKNKRKNKKTVSSTFNNFLEVGDNPKSLELISEEGKTNESIDLIKNRRNSSEYHEEEENITTNYQGKKEIIQDELRSSFVDNVGNSDTEICDETVQYPIFNLVKSLSTEHLLDPVDSKPKIVHVVYKKNPD